MNKYYLYGGGALIVLIGIFVVSQAGPSRPSTATANTPNLAVSATTTATVTSGTSPQDIVPGLYPNQIKNAATTQGIKIASIIVENNVDSAGNAVSDHLEFTVQNLTNTKLSNPEVYYTVTDLANGKQEGYYRKLTGLTIASRSSSTIHFDGGSGAGHYPVNMRGIYGTTTDQLKFTVKVSVSGYALVYAEATKASGGAEVVGQ